MKDIVEGIRVGVERTYEIESMDVIDISVVVVVDTVARRFRTDWSDIGGQIGVVVVDAGIDDANDHISIAGCDIPCLRGIGVSASALPPLWPVLCSPPQIAELRVIGKSLLRPDNEIRFGIFENASLLKSAFELLVGT